MPQISIVTATFNRSNVLRHAIESVLRSTFTDWELIVVGDACTDDSAAVVRAFGDPRISFVNLPVNSGEQATPNNEGVLRARGEYVAFLNHDDLWSPDHLATCLAAIGEADFVWTATAAIDHDDRVRLAGVCPRGEYEPRVFVPASSWLVRRELFDHIGGWRPARTLYVAPSQEWIFRAWKRGARLRPIAKADVIAVLSGRRTRSYADRHESEIAHYAELLRNDPECIAHVLAPLALAPAAERHGAMRVVKDLAIRALTLAGFHPHSFYGWLKHRRRGGHVDALRRTRGLPPLPRGNES